MRVESESQGEPHIILLADSDPERAAVASAWLRFDSRTCECFDPADRVRIMAMINRYPGGAIAFNVCIRQFAKDLRRRRGLAKDFDEELCEEEDAAGRVLELRHVQPFCGETKGLARYVEDHVEHAFCRDKDGLGDFCMAI